MHAMTIKLVPLIKKGHIFDTSHDMWCSLQTRLVLIGP